MQTQLYILNFWQELFEKNNLLCYIYLLLVNNIVKLNNEM